MEMKPALVRASLRIVSVLTLLEWLPAEIVQLDQIEGAQHGASPCASRSDQSATVDDPSGHFNSVIRRQAFHSACCKNRYFILRDECSDVLAVQPANMCSPSVGRAFKWLDPVVLVGFDDHRCLRCES